MGVNQEVYVYQAAGKAMMSQGEILVNGINIKEYDYEKYAQQVFCCISGPANCSHVRL